MLNAKIKEAKALTQALAEEGKAEEPKRQEPPETLDDHLKRCSYDHWRVVHSTVNIRSQASTESKQVSMLRQGTFVCVACEQARSWDGKWVRLCESSKVWVRATSKEPEWIFGANQKDGYMLIHHETLGPLIRLVPNFQKWETDGLPADGQPSGDVVKAAAEAARAAEAAAPKVQVWQEFLSEQGGKPYYLNRLNREGRWEKPPELGGNGEFSTVDHFVVETDSARIYAQRDENGPVEFSLEKGDLVSVGGRAWTRINREGNKEWLVCPAGTQVYRRMNIITAVQKWTCELGSEGFKRSGYILMSDGETRLCRQHTPAETGISVREVSAYGEPWIVEHEQVVVRQEPNVEARPLGIMLKGDVVGVVQRQDHWVQLVEDSDVRFRKNGGKDVSSVNAILARKVHDNQLGSPPLRDQSMPPTQAWMMVEHPQHGQLLRRARKRKGGLGNGCIISEARLGIYREVIDLCHQRIYEENLEGLWDGERDKLPEKDVLEAKLFDGNTKVIHVTSEGSFAGGAIIKSVQVKAVQLEGNVMNLAGSSARVAGSDGIQGKTTVGYIDSAAAVPRKGAGKTIWDSIANMRFVCVTCHSILLQKTVDFWQACGMRRMEASKEADCKEFKRQVLVHTMGKVVCELADLEAALPSSKLPLFVYVPSRLSEMNVDAHSDYVFIPDDDEAPYR